MTYGWDPIETTLLYPIDYPPVVDKETSYLHEDKCHANGASSVVESHLKTAFSWQDAGGRKHFACLVTIRGRLGNVFGEQESLTVLDASAQPL